MRYKPKILSLARNDLKEIRDYLKDFGNVPKHKFRKSFDKYAIDVSNNPYIYPEYEENKNYRKAIIEYGYLVFYTVDEEKKVVGIMRVLSSRRNVEDIIR